MNDILGGIAAIVIGGVALWWLWQGLAGTWNLVMYMISRRFWLNTIGWIILIAVFGWNVIPIFLVIAVCLGSITKAIAANLWANEIKRLVKTRR